MNQRTLDAIRALYADWWDGLHAIGPDDLEAQTAHALLTGALVSYVPDLVDEVERLQAMAPSQPARMIKLDSQRGFA